jgi:hypothetical protein
MVLPTIPVPKIAIFMIASGRISSSRMPAMTALATLGLWLGLTAVDAAAPAKPATPAKLPPAIGKEMSDAIIAVNKSLGLESWPAHGVKPCIDRGGQGILAKDVTPEQAQKCAAAAVEKGLPALGKSYSVAILMGAIGPVTVIAVGTNDAAGWGAYSCDPTKTCKPMKVGADNKWGKRLGERVAKACAEPTTLWLPARACP